MSKMKLLSILSAGLLLSNILLIGFLFFKKPPHPRPEGPRNLIIEKLHFDEKQILAYDKLIDWHRSEIRNTEQNIMDLKSVLYTGVANNIDSIKKDSLILELGKKQMQIEQIHFKHFTDIKNICTEKQQENFKELSEELSHLFAPKHTKGRRP